MPKEYIERGALIRELPEQERIDIMGIYDSIRTLPNADVVEVTYCKYCEKWNEKSGLCSRYSHDVENVRLLQYTQPTDFCSYGKRKNKN